MSFIRLPPVDGPLLCQRQRTAAHFSEMRRPVKKSSQECGSLRAFRGQFKKNVQRRNAVLFDGTVLRVDLLLYVLGCYGFIGRKFLDNIFSVDRFGLYFECRKQPGYLPINIRHDTQEVHPHQ